eukprot:96014_1
MIILSIESVIWIAVIIHRIGVVMYDSFIADHDHKETSPPPRRTNEWRRRRLQSESTHAELASGNDPGMVAEEGDDTGKTVSIVATLQRYYLNADFGVGSVQIVLSAIFYLESFDPLTQPDLPECSSGDSPSLYDSSPPSSGYCEVDYSSCPKGGEYGVIVLILVFGMLFGVVFFKYHRFFNPLDDDLDTQIMVQFNKADKSLKIMDLAKSKP